jgi:nucleotide-binding universal stress UspA family protein
MKILLAADGSEYTKKALDFLVAREELCGPGDELIVLNVQSPVPPGVKGMVGADAVASYHSEEAAKVIDPIEALLSAQKKIRYRCTWVVGSASEEILRAVAAEKAQMLVMGTHGWGLVGRFFMGSVAQRVLVDCEVPVLLVK